MSGIDTGFSYQAFEQLVHHFADAVPQLLLRRPETAELAFQIEKLQLTQSLEARFTVAIIGQMRVGKSTLLNALIGRKLAPTGVNETTATINWFRYDAGELCDKFRVHWNDGSTQDVSLKQVVQWVGQQENATQTRALDFFADSEFLKTANIVDTPGTRSVLDHHEATTQGFIGEKLEAETLKYGGRADAILYVINPIARETDRDLLQFFGERTRLPGASAYNSIAVVQKWEHLAPDPLVEVERKCERLREQLQGKVAEVIPTSGLLANIAITASPDVWDDIAKLATESPPETVRYLLRADSYFCRDRAGAALESTRRAALSKALEWPALRFAVQLAQSRGIAEGPALHQAILEASGLERLKALLRTRFFSLAGLIKASTVLRKAWEPCNVALLRLRDHAEQRKGNLELGAKSEAILSDRVQGDATLSPVLEYVTHSRASVQNDLQQIETIQQDLDAIRARATARFQFLDSDIACLKELESLSGEEILSAEERAELYRLFGANGPDIRSRLGLPADGDINEEVKDVIWDRHDHWASRKVRASGELRALCEHAVVCLDKILDALEDEAHA
jgi:hypothetical protein